jgi:hypothetical protein
MLSHGGMERIENVVDYFEDLLWYMHYPTSDVTIVQTRTLDAEVTYNTWSCKLWWDR